MSLLQTFLKLRVISQHARYLLSHDCQIGLRHDITKSKPVLQQLTVNYANVMKQIADIRNSMAKKFGNSGGDGK